MKIGYAVKLSLVCIVHESAGQQKDVFWSVNVNEFCVGDRCQRKRQLQKNGDSVRISISLWKAILPPRILNWQELLEAWLALTSVNYHWKVLISISVDHAPRNRPLADKTLPNKKNNKIFE